MAKRFEFSVDGVPQVWMEEGYGYVRLEERYSEPGIIKSERFPNEHKAALALMHHCSSAYIANREK